MCSVVTKWELSNTAKLSVLKSVFVPILTYGHESRVMTWIILSQVQAAEMGFLRRVHGATLRDKVRSCQIRKTTNVDPLFRIERPQLGSAMCPECPRKDWKGMACWLHPRESVPEVVQVPGGVEWLYLRPCLVLSWSGASRATVSEIAVDRELFRVLVGLLQSRFFCDELRAWKWMRHAGPQWRHMWWRLICCSVSDTNKLPSSPTMYSIPPFSCYPRQTWVSYVTVLSSMRYIFVDDIFAVATVPP